MDNKSKRSSKNKSKKKNKKVIIISTILAIILLVGAGAFGYMYSMLSKVKTAQIDRSKEATGITQEIENKIIDEDPNHEVTNIALFGVDRRSKDEASRSDALMIASIDKKHKKIKITSIMRDLYVDVPGHGKTKITHAYAYGGAQLAIKTLNQNFKLNITDYATVDFFSLEKIIDKLGGVTIDVTKAEVPYINGYMQETAGIEGKAIETIAGPGRLKLNGMQAVAYTRIRYVGNDQERTERQRKVLSAMFDKIQASGATKYPVVVSTILPYVETSMTKSDIITTGTEVFTSGIRKLDQNRYPLDGEGSGQMINKVYYMVADIAKITEQLHKYIYQDVK